MDIELPNGVVIQDVPEGTSKTAIMTRAINSGLAQPSDFREMATAPSSGFVMGLKSPISGAAELLPKALSQVTSLGGLAPNVVSKYLESEAKRVQEMNRAEQAVYEAQRKAAGETGFDFPKLAGEVLSPATWAGGAGALKVAKAVAPKLGVGGQAVVSGVGGSIVQPTTGQEGKSFGQEKLEQAVIGGVGGKIGQEVASGVGKVLNPLASKAEQTMRDLGIRPTIGQKLGDTAKTFEEFAQSLPLIGKDIQSARQRVLFDFNEGVINKTLAKVDEKLPEKVIGRDAIAHASDILDQKYDDVLNKMSFDLNFKVTSDMLGALNDAKLLSPQQRESVTKLLNDTVLSKFSGQKLTGQEYKAIESDLRQVASKYSTSAMASDREIGDALTKVLGVFKKELYFQNPKQTSQLRRVDSAYGDLTILQTAAANSGAESGVFTPKQYASAVRQADKTRRKSAFAKGRARGQEVSDAALEVLGEESASTLFGRQAIGTAGGLGIFSQYPMATAIAVPAIKAAYSPAGQQAIDIAMRSRPEVARQLGGLFQNQAPVFGTVGGLPIIDYNISQRR